MEVIIKTGKIKTEIFCSSHELLNVVRLTAKICYAGPAIKIQCNSCVSVISSESSVRRRAKNTQIDFQHRIYDYDQGMVNVKFVSPFSILKGNVCLEEQPRIRTHRNRQGLSRCSDAERGRRRQEEVRLQQRPERRGQG